MTLTQYVTNPSLSLYKIPTPALLEACFADDQICNLLTHGLDLRDEKDVGLYCILGGIESVGALKVVVLTLQLVVGLLKLVVMVEELTVVVQEL